MRHNKTIFQHIAEQIGAATGQVFTLLAADPLSGGDINSAYRLRGNGQNYFVKLNRAALLPMFQAEQAGLEALAETHTVRVPIPILSGIAADQAFLVLEYLPLGRNSPESSHSLGQQLALMHQIEQAFFGWHSDNTIGSTPQPNPRYRDWACFWQEQRLGFQLRLAAEHGYRGALQTLGERLYARLGQFFTDYQPQPSLLHGDLWGGNAAADERGRPVIFDPACYFGDREADLAMTELFGGFGRDFYAAYQAHWPLDPGYASRKTLYNLYHILNHLNLFGGGYQAQAETMMAKLLAELG